MNAGAAEASGFLSCFALAHSLQAEFLEAAPGPYLLASLIILFFGPGVSRSMPC
jgi:hypothetical protein